MLIVCPSCATSYEVEAATLEPNGRRVRCVRCRSVWHAEPSRADRLLAAAEAIAPDRLPADAAIDMVTAAETTASEAEWANAPAQAPDHMWDEDTPAAETHETDPGAAGDGAAAYAPVDDAIAVEAPPIVPIDLDAGRPPLDIDSDDLPEAPAEPPEDIETYAARRQKLLDRRNRFRWPFSGLQNVILALLIVDAILVGWRDALVRILPQTASFYATMGLPVNLRGLDFENVATATEQHEGVPILVVDGSIVNVSRKIVDLPRLKFAVRNAAGDEIYSWTAVPPRANLPPGEAVDFHSRLASPPPGGQAVLVRFMTRRDIISSGH